MIGNKEMGNAVLLRDFWLVGKPEVIREADDPSTRSWDIKMRALGNYSLAPAVALNH